MVSKILILGIGSPFGDDRLGWVVLEALQHSSALTAVTDGSISFAVLDRPGALLPAQWHGADCVIVVDAVRSGAPPGTCHTFGADEWTALQPVSSHGFGLAAALGLARVLDALPPYLVVYGMEIDPSNTAFSLSAPVGRALSGLIREIERAALAFAWPHVYRHTMLP